MLCSGGGTGGLGLPAGNVLSNGVTVRGLCGQRACVAQALCVCKWNSRGQAALGLWLLVLGEGVGEEGEELAPPGGLNGRISNESDFEWVYFFWIRRRWRLPLPCSRALACLFLRQHSTAGM